MFSIINFFSNIFYSKNKINIENIENIKLQKENKIKILNDIYDLKILDDAQVKNFKLLSYNSLVELLNAFNVNQKSILELLERESLNNEIKIDLK